jgi:hypothetical protein
MVELCDAAPLRPYETDDEIRARCARRWNSITRSTEFEELPLLTRYEERVFAPTLERPDFVFPGD